MATLKDHQQAMVDLLASGSGIPASASRLAHAMHDVLKYLEDRVYQLHPEFVISGVTDATTPGLNDKALSKREKPVKTDSPAKWPTSAEQRVKELENTIRQLKANLAHERACVAELNGFLESAKKTETKLRAELEDARAYLDIARHEVECVRIAYDPDYCVPEQAGIRKDDTQVCARLSDHDFAVDTGRCVYCGKHHRQVTL